jgi:hypothetical protein
MTDTVPSKNRVETFLDQVITFENQLQGFSSGMDLTELVEYGEESITSMERVIGKIVREVGKATDSDVDVNGKAIQIWSNGMLALSRIAIHIGELQDRGGHHHDEGTSTRKHSRDNVASCFDDLTIHYRVDICPNNINNWSYKTVGEPSMRLEDR